MRRLLFGGVAPSVFAVTSLFSTLALAEEEVLMRNAISFHECPATISAMLQHLGANNNNVRTISDTGAHYYVELASLGANLEFRCNAVSEQLEVARVTPGTLRMVSD